MSKSLTGPRLSYPLEYARLEKSLAWGVKFIKSGPTSLTPCAGSICHAFCRPEDVTLILVLLEEDTTYFAANLDVSKAIEDGGEQLGLEDGRRS